MKKETYTSFLQDYEKDAGDKKAELERELQIDIGNVLASDSGRRFIWWLLSITGVYLPSYTGNSDTYFNEGRRAVGLEVGHRVAHISPKAFVDMITSGEVKKDE